MVATRNTCHAWTVWVSASSPRVRAIDAATDWVISRIRRFGYRSAITPPTSPNRSTGRNCRATATPTAVMLPVSSRTNQSWAMRCIQSPVVATICELR